MEDARTQPLPRLRFPAGLAAPAFALQDSPHSRATLEDFRGRVVVLVFYGADWQPVATAQLSLYQELLPHLGRLGAVRFTLLSDDAPRGGVARAYGIYMPDTGRRQRALFVIDPDPDTG